MGKNEAAVNKIETILFYLKTQDMDELPYDVLEALIDTVLAELPKTNCACQKSS